MTGQVAQAHILSGQPMLLLGYARSPNHPHSTAETEAAGGGGANPGPTQVVRLNGRAGEGTMRPGDHEADCQGTALRSQPCTARLPISPPGPTLAPAQVP